MSPGRVDRAVVADRLGCVDRLLGEIKSLPLADRELFLGDSRNVWSAESHLRRLLEALFDVGRHILAKGFGSPVSEYRAIAVTLAETGVLTAEEGQLLASMAGYRNRLVHLYHLVGPEELYDLCATRLPDVVTVANGYRRWLREHPERVAPRG